MIGIFDSGSGGLTVLTAIRKEFPSTDIVYFADLKYAPYGNRSREELTMRMVEALKILVGNGATCIVSACNSVSASLAISLFDALSIAPDRLIEMVGPTVAGMRGSSKRILLVATQATIDSKIYQSAFSMIGKTIETLALPELAGAIEHGVDENAIEDMIRKEFSHIDFTSFDAVVLACTHYPLVSPVFRKVLPEHIEIVDPADAVASRVLQDWWPREVGKGTQRFLLSADSSIFRSRVVELFPNTTSTIEVLEETI